MQYSMVFFFGGNSGSMRCSSQRKATSSLQAVIKEAGVPLGREGVEGKVLWLGCSELHVSSILVLVVLESLMGPVQGADVGFG